MLAFRRGGRASLGLVGAAAPTPDGECVQRRWVAKQVPKHWNPSQFQGMLESNKWRIIKDVQPPARPGGVWTFSAARPESCKEDCFVLSIFDSKPLVITPWKKVLPKPEFTPLRAAHAWGAFEGERQPQSAAMPKDTPKDTDGPDMQVDQEGLAAAGANRAAEDETADAQRSAPKAKTAKPTGLQGPGPHGVEMHDYGSNGGDCALRCFTGMQARRNGIDADTVAAKVFVSRSMCGCRIIGAGGKPGVLTLRVLRPRRVVRVPLLRTSV